MSKSLTHKNHRRAAGMVALLWLSALYVPLAQDDSDCLACHGKAGLQVDRDGRFVSLHVDKKRAAKSVHADLDCLSCHEDLDGVETWPHATGLEPVQCGECHDDDDGPIAAFWSSTHGRLAEEGDKDAPLCQDCHGNHYILPLSDRDSAVSPFNIPAMCPMPCGRRGGPANPRYPPTPDPSAIQTEHPW